MKNTAPLTAGLPSLFTRDFVLLCLVTFGYFSSFFFFFPTLPFYITHLGGREADVGFLIGLSSLVACLVKPFAGRWVDQHGRVWLMSVAAGVFACMAVMHARALSLAILFALRIVYGVALGLMSGTTLHPIEEQLAEEQLAAVLPARW